MCDDILSALEKQLGLQRGALIDLHDLSTQSGDHVRFLKCPSQKKEDRQTAVGSVLPCSLSPLSHPSTTHFLYTLFLLLQFFLLLLNEDGQKSRSSLAVQVGEHTDFGSITVLFNRLAGLRIVEPGVNNAWEDWPWVPPKSNHAIINLGDAMVKLTNGLFRSNVHRVDPPPSEQASAARFSLVYFSRPMDDVLLKRVQGSELIPPLAEGMVRSPLSHHAPSIHLHFLRPRGSSSVMHMRTLTTILNRSKKTLIAKTGCSDAQWASAWKTSKAKTTGIGCRGQRRS